MNYNNLCPMALAYVMDERKIKITMENILTPPSSLLLQEDEKDPSYLIDVEELKYFTHVRVDKILSYLAFYGAKIDTLTFHHYPITENHKLYARACEIISSGNVKVDKREHELVIRLISSIFIDQSLLNLTELVKGMKDAEEYKKRKERKERIEDFLYYGDIISIFSKKYQDISLLFREDLEWPEIYENEDNKDSSLIVYLASKFGMLIPLTETEPLSYFRNSIIDYLPKGTRDDLSYFKENNGYYPYTDSKDIYKSVKNGYFLIPLEYKNVENKETSLRSKCIELKTDDVIAFTINGKQRWYEIDELELAFTNVVKGFIKPEDPKAFFSLREINRLQNLIAFYPNRKYDKISKLIKQGKNILSLVSQEESELKERLKDNKEFKELLHSIFECGMYMRRWKGPGHKYPIESKETEVNVDAEELEKRVREKLELIKDKDFKGIRVKGRGGYLLGIDFFKDLFKEVYQGVFCIRVASLYFIDTACYYLLNIYEERIENYTYDADLIA